MKAPIRIVALLAAAALLAACREPNLPAAKQPTAPPQSEQPTIAALTTRVDDARLAALDVGGAGVQTTCNIEGGGGASFASGVLSLGKGEPVWGWLGHATAGPVRDPMLLLLNGDGAPVAGVRIELVGQRDDVVAANGGREDLRTSGFTTAVPDLAAGTYALVLLYQVDGSTYRCDNGRKITMG